MIKDEIIVRRYADAYVGFLKETIGLDKGLRDLRHLKQTIINPAPEFLEFLDRPDITHKEKYEFIDNVARDDFSDETKNFLKFLSDKGRINRLADIIEYIRINYSHPGRVEAVLKTRFPLDPDLIKLIQDSLEKKYKKKFKLFINLDAQMLGGIQIIFGNIVIDDSLRGRLDDLKQELMQIRI
jgi:F-type H+-transporting ATPase subunit delta